MPGRNVAKIPSSLAALPLFGCSTTLVIIQRWVVRLVQHLLFDEGRGKLLSPEQLG